MKTKQSWLLAFAVSAICSAPAAAVNAVLTIEMAAQIATEHDPSVARLTALATALRHDAIADGQWSDPKLKLAAFAVPIDLDLDTDPITQYQIGVQQVFPRGDSLRHKQQKTNAQATQTSIQRQDLLRKIRLAAQTHYLDVSYQVAALTLIRASRSVFQSILAISKVHFASGTQQQQQVIQTKLELSALDDREIRLQQAEDNARETLAKWIGQAAYLPLTDCPVELPALLSSEAISARLIEHPVIAQADAAIAAQHADVALAEDQYRLGWSLDLTLSKRFARNNRGQVDDLVSATVLVDLPLFPEKRQDRRLSAQKARVVASRYHRTDQVRELQHQFNVNMIRWQRLQQRQRLMSDRILPEASQNAQAAMLAYQSQVADFSTLLRAQLTLLEMRLQDLRITTDAQKVHAELLYFQGDAK